MVRWMFGVLAVAVALGFAPAPALQPWATVMSGKPVQVFCWSTPIIAAGHEQGSGYTDSVGGTQIYLSRAACAALRTSLRQRKVASYSQAVAFFILVHEAFHIRGDADESQTDCDALHHMPGYMRSLLHSTHPQIANAMLYAWDAHEREPAAYTQLC